MFTIEMFQRRLNDEDIASYQPGIDLGEVVRKMVGEAKKVKVYAKVEEMSKDDVAHTSKWASTGKRPTNQLGLKYGSKACGPPRIRRMIGSSISSCTNPRLRKRVGSKQQDSHP